MIGATRRPIRDGNFCKRCGVPVNKPRPDAQCTDCRYTTNFEATAARRGIDLNTLGEDEFLIFKSSKTHIVNDLEQEKAA